MKPNSTGLRNLGLGDWLAPPLLDHRQNKIFSPVKRFSGDFQEPRSPEAGGEAAPGLGGRAGWGREGSK